VAELAKQGLSEREVLEPLLGDLLLIVNDNKKQQFIAAFDTKTGKPVWRTNWDLAAKGDGPQRSAWVTPLSGRTRNGRKW
jgi:hypothetical protein